MRFRTYIWLLLSIIMISALCSCSDENPVLPDNKNAFIKFYGGIRDQEGYDVKQTNDGGYILLGSTNSFGNGGKDVFLVKVDEFGNEEWTRTYGGEYEDVGRSVIITADNNYVIAGDYGYSDGSTDVYLLKVDNLGNVIFEYKFGNNNLTSDEHGNEVKQTLDGGLIIVGSTSNPDRPETGPVDFYLIKTNGNGQLQWQRTRGFENSEEIGQSVVQLNSDHFIVVGTTENAREDESQDGHNIFAYKINANGDNISNRFYGGLGEDFGNKICKTDFGYAILGTSNSSFEDSKGGYDMIIVQIDENLSDFSTRTYGGPLDEIGSSLAQLQDGSFIIVGSTNSYSTGGDNSDIYLLKTDFSGVELDDWSQKPRVFGGDGNDIGNAVIETPLGFVMVGTSTFFEATDNRVLNLIKTNPEGSLIK